MLEHNMSAMSPLLPSLPPFPALPPLVCLSSNEPISVQITAWLKILEAVLATQLAATLNTELTNSPTQADTPALSIRQMVLTRSRAIDELLSTLFRLYGLDSTEFALFATGGYGRDELHLHSDVDMLLLHPTAIDEALQQKIAPFIAVLWDIGIEPAIAVRSVTECHQACHDDITVATSLLEARLLIGNTTLANIPYQILAAQWSPQDFYQAKMDETKVRYLKHNATEYNLEPDIKNAPGGLRDIHMVGWISKRYFRVTSLFDLVQQDFITEREFDELQAAEDFLWLIRHHLHALTKRNENRLLFDYQRTIAELLGYTTLPNDHPNAGVERFMRDYYRFAMSNSTLAEMLTQHYYEALIEPILPESQKPVKKPINQHFKQVGDRIAMSHNKVFAQHPEAILELFLLMGQLDIKGVRTRTLRLLKIASRSIDQSYRDNVLHQQLFLANLKEQNYLYHRLRMMKRYGVLGQYLPAFGQVTGLMQYDLFHRYTVDAHTLLLVRMLHRFTDDDLVKGYQQQFPLVSEIYRRIDRKEILVLAAIFHDIAKGRGGDHSELGEIEAVAFCLQHGLTQADAHLVGWLTRQHLLMSLTAQKKDISDPEVIADFAEKVGNVTYLNHLYVLTVADMNATNPQLWNSWKGTLMRQLYTQTRRILRADINAPTNRQYMIATNKAQTSTLLHNDTSLSQHHLTQIETLWKQLGDEYFLRELPEDIIWHSKAIIAHPHYLDNDSPPLIMLREHRNLALDAVQIFVYTHDRANLFAVTMAVFDLMDLDVLDARIITASQDFVLDSYIVLDRHGTLLNEQTRQQELIERLNHAFANPTLPKSAQRRLPRMLKHFNVPTKVNFEFNASSQQHLLNLETLDEPALLARVGQVFLQHGIAVRYARITTLGERAEDIFYITGQNDAVLSDEQLKNLQQALIDTFGH